MIYVLVNCLEIILTAIAIYNWVGVIARTTHKIFIPPTVRKKKLMGLYCLLFSACFAWGLVVNSLLKGLYEEPYSAVLGLLCCIVMYFSSSQFLRVAKERIVTVKDTDYVDIVD